MHERILRILWDMDISSFLHSELLDTLRQISNAEKSAS
jgi:hypothetical protein